MLIYNLGPQEMKRVRNSCRSISEQNMRITAFTRSLLGRPIRKSLPLFSVESESSEEDNSDCICTNKSLSSDVACLSEANVRPTKLKIFITLDNCY